MSKECTSVADVSLSSSHRNALLKSIKDATNRINNTTIIPPVYVVLFKILCEFSGNIAWANM